MAKTASQTEEENNLGIASSADYLVNQELFDKASSIKKELDTINQRLESMTDHKDKVSQEVFQRVLKDYQEQKKEVISRFEDKRKEISKELLELYTAQSQFDGKKLEIEKILEEARFRHTLQEYSDKEFSKIEKEETQKIDAFQKILDTIQNSITEYENILGGPLEDTTPKSDKLESSTPVAEPALDEIEDLPEEAQKVEESISEVLENLEISSDDLQSSDLEEIDLEDDIALDDVLNTENEEILDLPDSEEDLDLDQIAALQDDEVEDDDLGSLDDELDNLLNDDEELFQDAKEEKAADTSEEEAPVPEISSEKKTQFDDSLSSILRDIPLEEEDKGEDLSLQNSFSESHSDTNAKLDFSKEEGEPRLVLESGNYEEDEVVLAENISFGRSPSNDIVLREAKVSRQHAAINFMNGKFVIVDLKSSNGVYVNSKKIEEHVLEDGDIIEIASFKFRFQQ